MTLVPPRTDRERLDWLRLTRSENVGPVTFRTLIERLGNASAALDALPRLARRGGRREALKLCGREEAEHELSALAELGGRFLYLGEAPYPRLLAAIEDAPPVLAVMGEPHLLEKPAVAIVGARNASAAGIRIARRLASELGEAGFVVVSGLARGVDAAAHAGALQGGTIAALAGGLDNIYPPENAELYAAIKSQGVLVSEMPLGTAPQARHFPRRNRLISGLAHGVVVVEAAERSGSLITARLALEQGREVLAVPGSPLDARAHGTNKLIRAGATLVQSAADILEALSRPEGQRLREPEPAAPSDGPEAALPDESEMATARALIVERLGPSPIEVDELVRQTGFSPAVVLSVLLELELAGRLERQPGQRVCLL
jgi:DNA processing protein